MADYILSHDLGTTGDKATLVDEKGNILAVSFAGYNTYYPKTGWVEQDAEDYWKAFCKTTRDIIARANIKPESIAVVSFSGQMMAALPVDENFNPLRRSIIWADMRSGKQVEDMLEKIEFERVYRITGHRPAASYSASKILWIKENEPEIYSTTYKFLHAKDFIVLRLTSNFFTDYSDASGMNLLDINSLKWSEEMLEITGIDKNKLPDIVESTSVAGKVREEVSGECGLKTGTPVVIGGGDGACATAGAGVVKRGDSYIYLGTSTWMGITDTRPLLDPEFRTFTFCHFKKGLYFAAGTMQTGGGAYGWFKNVMCEKEQEDSNNKDIDVYEILNNKAAEVEAGSDGLIFLPYLMGERTPLWDSNARGAFIGITIRHRKEHFIRAILEGVAYNMRSIVEIFRELGAKTEIIRIIGGGAKSELWRKILSDVINTKIGRLNLIEEATSFGAAIAGGVGVGIYDSIEEGAKIIKITDIVKPDEESVKRYNLYYEEFLNSYPALKEIFHRLSEVETG